VKYDCTQECDSVTLTFAHADLLLVVDDFTAYVSTDNLVLELPNEPSDLNVGADPAAIRLKTTVGIRFHDELRIVAARSRTPRSFEAADIAARIEGYTTSPLNVAVEILHGPRNKKADWATERPFAEHADRSGGMEPKPGLHIIGWAQGQPGICPPDHLLIVAVHISDLGGSIGSGPFGA
jgi:hypothetical protein